MWQWTRRMQPDSESLCMCMQVYMYACMCISYLNGHMYTYIHTSFWPVKGHAERMISMSAYLSALATPLSKVSHIQTHTYMSIHRCMHAYIPHFGQSLTYIHTYMSIACIHTSFWSVKGHAERMMSVSAYLSRCSRYTTLMSEITYTQTHTYMSIYRCMHAYIPHFDPWKDMLSVWCPWVHTCRL